jgi:hypothetical protein
MAVVVLPGEVDLHDVRMRERSRRLGFTDEALQEGGILGQVLGENLDGHETIERLVAPFVDHSHPTAPELRNHLVRSDFFRHVHVPCSSATEEKDCTANSGMRPERATIPT